MKKIILLLNFIMLFILSSCFFNNSYEYANYFSSKFLKENMVEDLVEPVEAINIKANSARNITYETTYENFMLYVHNIYEYLNNKGFIVLVEGFYEHLMFGPRYELYDSNCIDDHLKIDYETGYLNENAYVFAYCKKLNEANKPVEGNVINIEFNDGVVNMWFNEDGLFGYSYDKDRGYYAGVTFPWLKTISNDVVRVKKTIIENGIEAVGYLYDELDIKSVLISKGFLIRYDKPVDEKWKEIYNYELNDGTIYTITIVNGYLLLGGNYYQDIKNAFGNCLDLEKLSELSFKMVDEEVYYAQYTSHFGSNPTPLILKDIEFVKINDKFDNPAYLIYRSNDRIEIYTNNIFSIKGTFYKITSEKDLTELFD